MSRFIGALVFGCGVGALGVFIADSAGWSINVFASGFCVGMVTSAAMDLIRGIRR